jgi:hypothetical protein
MTTGAHPEFSWAGADPEATYNLCLNLKIVLKITL